MVVSGNLTAAQVTDVDALSPQSLYARQLDALRRSVTTYHEYIYPQHDVNIPCGLSVVLRCLCRVSETIPLLFVPGPNNVGREPSPDSIGEDARRLLKSNVYRKCDFSFITFWILEFSALQLPVRCRLFRILFLRSALYSHQQLSHDPS